MRRALAVLLAITCCFSLTGCASDRGTAGATIGCIVGGVIGLAVSKGNVGSGAIGCAAGGAGGYVIGSILDAREKRELAEASVRAAWSPTGDRIGWGQPEQASAQNNVDSATGWVMPVSDIYVASNGRQCRNLEQYAQKGGQSYDQNVTACKMNGQWIVPG